jgi:CheY-like chemotaxis protein
MGKAGGTMLVLVVDDNVDSAELLQALLERHDCHVLMAPDGASALALCAAERPGLVLLDLGLPDIDGYEVARRLRQMPAMARSRLVALSGYGPQEDRGKTPAAGLDAHLTKPVDPDAVIDQLRLARAGAGSLEAAQR